MLQPLDYDTQEIATNIHLQDEVLKLAQEAISRTKREMKLLDSLSSQLTHLRQQIARLE